MNFQVFVVDEVGYPLPMQLGDDGELQLMNAAQDELFRAARDRVVAVAGSVDPGLQHGSLEWESSVQAAAVLLGTVGRPQDCEGKYTTRQVQTAVSCPMKPEAVAELAGLADPWQPAVYSATEFLVACGAGNLGVEWVYEKTLSLPVLQDGGDPQQSGGGS